MSTVYVNTCTKLAAKGIALEGPLIPSSISRERTKEEEQEKMLTKSILKTPSVTTKRPSIRAPSSGSSSVALLASADRVNNLFAKLSLNDACGYETAQGWLSYFHIAERWMDFDFNTEDKESFVLLRILLHSGIKKEDFEFEWIDKHTFIVKLKWPTFMRKVLMMRSLDMIQVGTSANGVTYCN